MFDQKYFEDRPVMLEENTKSYNYDLAIWLKGNFKFETFLDVGCGHGLLVEHLHNLHKKVLGLDTSGYVLDVLKNRNPNIEVEMASLPHLDGLEENRQFDIVYCSGVLEYLHYSTIISSIRNMMERVRLGGYLILDTIPEDQKKLDSMYKTVHDPIWWNQKLTKKPFRFAINNTPFSGMVEKWEDGRTGLFVIKK